MMSDLLKLFFIFFSFCFHLFAFCWAFETKRKTTKTTQKRNHVGDNSHGFNILFLFLFFVIWLSDDGKCVYFEKFRHEHIRLYRRWSLKWRQRRKANNAGHFFQLRVVSSSFSLTLYSQCDVPFHIFKSTLNCRIFLFFSSFLQLSKSAYSMNEGKKR